ncbi:MAG: hypothetical protein EA427_17160 [Spirochaetaceae bacterium]|nr:MAG: hypothetical protein EA427_17160 [Spirochaetaceae bacterium]
MPDSTGNLYLYEALELRGEYESRIKTSKECLPESRREDDGFGALRRGFGGDARFKPVAAADPATLREEVKALEHKRRKLNAAIQSANFSTTLTVDGEEITLAETLELRKSVKQSIADLHRQVTASAFIRVIHKEDRDIEDEPAYDFTTSRRELERARITFRTLNRMLREASHRIAVEFRDESSKN